MNKIELLPINKLVMDSTIEYGKEVNLNRHIPHIYDGLKPSYRKVILSGLDLENNKLTKTSKVIADTSKYTTHGTDLLKDVAGVLVRWNIFDGQGIIGLTKALDVEQDDASPRYTEIKVNSNFRQTTKELLPLVSSTINELGNVEPNYIPTPLPILPQFGGIGMGVGCKVVMPAFTKESMLDAYLNDDPYKLVFNYGYQLLEGDLKDIWENNSAKYKLSFPFEETNDEIIVYGNPELFKINFKTINKLIDDGQLQMINLSHKGINKLIFKRQPNAKKLTIQKLKDIIKTSISQNMTFNMLVHNGESVYEINLKDWISTTYNNYIRLLKKSNNLKIDKLNFDIEVNNNFEQVAKILVDKSNKDTYQQIADKLNIVVDIVEAIGRKSLNTLRNPAELNNDKLIEQISKLEKFNYDQHIKDIVNGK